MIRLAIAGMGFIGQTHYAASRKVPDASVVAVCTSRPDVARQQSDPDVRLYQNYREMLADSRPDAVLVCVPTFLHEQYVTEALAQGCHVLCEKPFALNARTAEKIVEARDRAGVALMVAQVLRFWPQYVAIKQMVDQDKLGPVNALRAYRLAPYPAWGEWFRDPTKSGGSLLDVQVHDVDFVYWLMGLPLEVQTVGLKSECGSWDHVSTTLRYDNAIATIEASFLMPDSWPFSCYLRVCGTQAAAEYNFRVSGNIEQRDSATDELTLYPAGGSPSQVPVEREDMYVAQLGHFVSRVKENQCSDVVPLQQTLDVMRIMDALLESAERGKWITLHQSIR